MCVCDVSQTVRTDLVVDIGKSLNPSIDIGQVTHTSVHTPPYHCIVMYHSMFCVCVCVCQIEGAFIQGLGLYTMEELHFSPSGVLYTRGPAQYKIPAVCDVPLQFNVYLLSGSQNPHAIYSSKVRASG